MKHWICGIFNKRAMAIGSLLNCGRGKLWIRKCSMLSKEYIGWFLKAVRACKDVWSLLINHEIAALCTQIILSSFYWWSDCLQLYKSIRIFMQISTYSVLASIKKLSISCHKELWKNKPVQNFMGKKRKNNLSLVKMT